MIALAMKDIEKYYGATKVLYNITLEINEEDKVALIGRNGSGKTTAFKIIAGIEGYDAGMLAIKKGTRVGYLEQMPDSFMGGTVYELLLSGMQEAVDLGREMESLESLMSLERDGDRLNELVEKYGRLRERFEHLDGYNMDTRLDSIVQGLLIPRDMYEKGFDTLSGGEKTRVLFARMLISQPDLLLLDEPTNHLDIEAIEWLEGFIREYKGTVIIISHDRYFLDKAVTRVIEIEDGECESYSGNYSYFVEEKERRLMLEFEAYQDQQKKIKHMEDAIKRLRDWGARGDNNKFFRRAASMQKALDRVQKLKRPVLERKNISLSFDMNDRSGKEVIAAKQIGKCFGDRVIFEGAELYVAFRETVGIIGGNGTGKSTFIKMVLEQESVDSGEIALGSSVKCGYLEQVIAFEDESRTILEEFKDKTGLEEQKSRNILAGFLFYRDSIFKRIRDLSGGEKTRLKLAELMHDDINLLILDEPTNHLDIETREVLEEALQDFGGTILFISHDRYFINKLADRLYNIEDRGFVAYCGGYDYFKEKHIVGQKLEVVKKEAQKKEYKPLRQPDPKQEKVKRENRIAVLEKEIEDTELKSSDLKAMMVDPQKSADYMLLQELDGRLKELEARLEVLYGEWESLQ